MKKNLIQVACMALSLSAYATQESAISKRQVQDPVQLRAILNANAADAESRLVAAGVTTAADITLTNSSNAGTASITADVDGSADAGDKNKILVPDNGGFKFQSDSASKGTLADILAFGNTGIVTMLGSATIDNSTSATVLNITEATVKVTGAFNVTGAVTLDTKLAQAQIATNNLGAITLVVLSTDSKTNTLTFNAQGILINNVITP
jgi:hypothetical protein